MEDLTKSGIYIIFNMETNKFYVGSAICIKRRWKDHKITLNKGIHPNKQLQRAWFKYGSCVFTFSVVEFVENQADLTNREQYWLDKLNACEKGYNTNPIAGSCLGRIHTAETKEKMRESALKRKNELSLAGKIGGAKSKGRIGGQKQREIVRAMMVGNKYAVGTKLSPERKQRLIADGIAAKVKTWIVINPEGGERLITNLSSFCKENGLQKQTMHNIAYGKGKQNKGWKCRIPSEDEIMEFYKEK